MKASFSIVIIKYAPTHCRLLSFNELASKSNASISQNIYQQTVKNGNKWTRPQFKVMQS